MVREKIRNYNLDFIRLFAFFCVVSVHFFLRSGFYDVPVVGKKIFIMICFRNFFMICVPLFISLTGYLMCNKELCFNYYKRILRVLATYLFCSIVYSIFIKFYHDIPFNLYDFFKNLLSYHGTPYAWYIEMYIGLFILIPFLNIIFNNLKNKRECQILLITLIILVSLPCMLNIYKIDELAWWYNPSSDGEYFQIFPSWWVSIYPLLYYFLGAYFRKYYIKVSTKKTIIFLLFVVFISGLFSFYRSYSSSFVIGIWNEYYSLFTFIQSFLVFSLILGLNFKIKNEKVRYFLKKMSDATLGAYLLSRIFDYIFYDKLCASFPVIEDRFIYAPIIIICIFFLSLLLSVIVNFIHDIIVKFFGYLISR